MNILNLALGNISLAIDLGYRSIEMADRSDDPELPAISRGRTAFALLQAGLTNPSKTLFEDAKRMVSGVTISLSPSSIQNYNELLLDQGSFTEIIENINQSEKSARSLLNIALDSLFMGCALSLGSAESSYHLEEAVLGLRRANQLDELPRGLLARAHHYRLRGSLPEAQSDLDEVRLLSHRSGMRLHLCDYQIEQGHLSLLQGSSSGARSHLAAAKILMEETGYRRRNGAVQALGAACDEADARS
jgi:hypothetical protein